MWCSGATNYGLPLIALASRDETRSGRISLFPASKHNPTEAREDKNFKAGIFTRLYPRGREGGDTNLMGRGGWAGLAQWGVGAPLKFFIKKIGGGGGRGLFQKIWPLLLGQYFCPTTSFAGKLLGGGGAYF